MKDIKSVLAEMESDLLKVKAGYENSQFVMYSGMAKRDLERSNGDMSDAKFGEHTGYATDYFNKVRPKVVTVYERRMGDVVAWKGKKLDSNVAKEVKMLKDGFFGYLQKNMPEWYGFAEQSRSLEKVKDGTREIVSRLGG